MNNYTETFNDFASKLGPTDLALYAGAAIILFVLFRDRMSPVQKLVMDFLDKGKNLLNKTPSNNIAPIVVPDVKSVNVENSKEDTFFKLVVSWKQTRDLAVQLKCVEAIKVADQMFPYLSPNSCGKDSQ